MTEAPQAFPLTWPQGYKRESYRKKSKFKVLFGRTVQALTSELRLLGASYPVISSNVPIRKDGLPYAGQAQPYDRGVACYFMWKGQQRVLACDKWDKVEDNIHAIELAVAAMRGLDRWGVSQMLDRAFAGFTSLPPPQSDVHIPWWAVLQFGSKPSSLDHAESAYRTLAKGIHPDLGGSTQQMAKLNWAIEQARKELRC